MGTARVMGHKIAKAAASVAVGVALVASTAAPASAETLNNNCESGEICLYWLSGYNGSLADMYDNVPDYSGWHFAASSTWLNDNTYSGKSRTSFWCTKLYEHANYQGSWLHFTPGQARSTFDWFNDRMSSHNFILC